MPSHFLYFLVALMAAVAVVITSLSVTLYYTAEARDRHAAEADALQGLYSELKTIQQVQAYQFEMMSGMWIREDVNSMFIAQLKKAHFIYEKVAKARGWIEVDETKELQEGGTQ